jgi:hypothetical protein
MSVGIFDVCDWRPIVWWLHRYGRNVIAHVIRDTDATNAYYYTLYVIRYYSDRRRRDKYTQGRVTRAAKPNENLRFDNNTVVRDTC